MFIAEGRDPTHSELEEYIVLKKMRERSIPEKLRAAGFAVNTAKGRVDEIKQEDRDGAMSMVQRYLNTLFLPGIGCIKTDPIKFEFKRGFNPTQPHRRGIPYSIGLYYKPGNHREEGSRSDPQEKAILWTQALNRNLPS